VTGAPAFLPLTGVRILDLSRMYPGGFCTLLLSDLGAEVIKAEQPGVGDPVRQGADGGDTPSHLALNRGKRSITLNLKEPAAHDVLRRLVEHVDVLVESQRPGSMEDMGIGYADLSAVNPGLIWCAITGFGQQSPYAERPGHEVTYLGHAGLLKAMAGERFPWVPQFFLAGPVAGLMASVGIFSALVERGRTGQGCQVDLSIVDADTWLLSDDVARASLGYPTPWWAESAQRRIYQCADGAMITVAADEPRTWKALCDGLGLDEFASSIPRTPEGQAEVEARLEGIFGTRPAASWVDALGPVWACVDPVNDPHSLLEDEHLVARGAIAEIADDPDRRRVFANPLHFVREGGRSARAPMRRPPVLGEDTEDVLGSIGFDTNEIEELSKSGAV
jgi:alpha-methylacyl-CoA racemase